MDQYLSSLRQRTRRFNLSWFTLNMAGGAIPLLFIHFVVGSATLPVKIIALILWAINLVLFSLFCGFLMARFIFHPSSIKELFAHPIEILYFGAFAMAFSTIINGGVQIIHNSLGWGGHRFICIMWGFWWLDIFIAFAVTFWVTHLMITQIDYTQQKAPILWMFPVAPLTVASTCSDTFSIALFPIDPHKAWLTAVFSVILLVVGLTLAVNFVAMHVEAYIVDGLPQGPQVISSIFPLAVYCQCSYSFLLLAGIFQQQLPLSWSQAQFLRSESTGPVLYIICFTIGFVLWAISTAWVVFAAVAIGHIALRGKLVFSPSWWSLIFPNVVYANLSIQLGNMADANVFRIWGATCACATFSLWVYIAMRSIAIQVREEIEFFRPPGLYAKKGMPPQKISEIESQ